ncbi:MAG TPA: sialate O-acetylesterase [Cyclobacteriaceae bacterium]|jgi:sialate O-acetylesterase|nr:sialate O-acetylesterase [Cyclobacteriaceae bacterium]
MRVTLLCFLAFVGVTSLGQIKLPKLISDGMVLQRDAKVKLWGWATPHEKIKLEFSGQQLKTEADALGHWVIVLPKQKFGGPFDMAFSASNEIKLKNILFGDVWLCSGQSNMELTMDRLRDKYPDAIANAGNPEIRQFLVPDAYDFEKPNEDVSNGEWLSVNQQTIAKFGAVGFFFAAELYAKYKVPIGLINAALGGSPADAWISEGAIKKFPEHYEELIKFKNKKLIEEIETADRKNSSEWFKFLNQTDHGLKLWSTENFDDSDWPALNIPGYWADGPLGNKNGAVWFRKEINVPKSMTGIAAKLLLGRIVDSDSVFINNEFVGATSYLYPPRRYMLKSSILKEGRNVIAVRVINSSGKGGFVPDKPYSLIVGTDSIDLKGNWKYKLGAEMKPLAGSTTIRWKPVGLYNAMIAPLTNYVIKGALWYQGESNTKNPSEYFPLMQTLIGDWRAKWGEGDFPFLLVQLANFMEEKKEPAESAWAEVRQAQLHTLKIPNTGLAVAIDLGEWNDVHPLNKKEVGRRLALQAMDVCYHEKNIVPSGPLFKSVKKSGDRLIISFKYDDGLKPLFGNELNYFSIAGADKKFVWAEAKIEDNKVVVTSERVPNPQFVRYAWADNPIGANLVNRELLPASPFEASVP